MPGPSEKTDPEDTVPLGTPLEYLCRCGYTFPGFLGAYGCPNCEGDNGRASPVEDERDQI